MRLTAGTPQRPPAVGLVPDVPEVEVPTVEVEVLRIPKLVRKDLVAEWLDVSEDTVDRLVKSGKLRRADLSSNVVRFRIQDVLEFIERSVEAGA